jgi:hypothetical protein
MPVSREFTGTVRVDAPVDKAFELFSDLGGGLESRAD